MRTMLIIFMFLGFPYIYLVGEENFILINDDRSHAFFQLSQIA